MSRWARSLRSWHVATGNVLAVAVVCAVVVTAASAARNARGASSAPVAVVNVLDAGETGILSPVGLAFSGPGRAFQVIGRSAGQPSVSDVVQLKPSTLAPDTARVGSARLALVADPVNMAYDARRGRLLLFGDARQLLDVQVRPDGNPVPASLKRRDAAGFRLRDPQGIAVDPARGTVFILDSRARRIVRVEPTADGSLEPAASSEIDLTRVAAGRLRGLAFDPSSGNLQLGAGKTLYEITTAGDVVAVRDLSGLELASPEGMVFAPSSDQTDAPGEQSLFVADSGGGPTSSSGQIVELSLVPQPEAAAASFTSSLVRTVDMAAFSPPSPDPSGITYLAASNTLLMSDGEVEETVSGITHFQGVNVWEMTLSGNVVRTANISKVPPTVVPMTNEPTGVAFNPGNGHYYFTDDGKKQVFDLNPGSDGRVGSSDDTWTSFATNGVGNGDPEGITYNTANGRLYVADGVNREIYEYTTGGALTSHFDVAQYGVQDPETVDFNPASGTLFTLSNRKSGPIIVETTTAGALLQTVNVAAAGAKKPAGLAYAPASNGSGLKRFYFVDRGVDNNSDPKIIDGKMYELTAPASGPPGNQAPSVNAGPDQSVTLPASASLDGTVTDDGLPTPPALTTTWSKQSGPGTVTFGNASAVDTTAGFSAAGTYVLRLTANDGQLSSFDDLTVTVSPTGGGGQVFEVRVGATADDAEEVAGSGSMQRNSGDLNMMSDTSDTKQVVGLRFLGVAIPKGATITSAYVQFAAHKVNSEATSLTIKGQAADNPGTFLSANFDLSTRPTTSASAAWSPPAWLTVGEAGPAQRTTSLTAVVQQIVNRAGWSSGNALVLLVTGSGKRLATSYNNNPARAALLHIEWT